MSPTHTTGHTTARSVSLAWLGITLLTTLPLQAATFTWDGGGTNRAWSTDTNWVDDTVPTPADDLEIILADASARYNPIVDLHNPWTLNRLHINNYQYSLSGNTLRFAGIAPRLLVGVTGADTHGFGFANPIEVVSDFTLQMEQNYNFYLGAVSGTGSLTVTGGGGARLGHLAGAGTYAGPTFIYGSLNIDGTAGRIVDSSRIDIYSYYISALAGGSGAATNRIVDTIPINLYAGALGNANTDETVGDVTAMGGFASISASAGILRLNRLNRYRAGACQISGASLGESGGPRVFVSNADTNGQTMTDYLVGGAGAAGSSTISIVPFLRGSETFLTYTGTDGFRQLNTTTEYGTSIVSAAASDNIRRQSSEALTADAAINSLAIPNLGPIGISGAYTLTINSGAILFSGNVKTHSITVSRLDFAGREAVITVYNTGGYSENMTVSSVMSNAAGLTFAATGTSNSRLTLSGASVYTGRTAVLAGSLILSAANRLPTNTWVSIGYGGLLTFNGSHSLTGLEGMGGAAINGAAVVLTLDTASDFDYAGAVSGSGKLLKTGAGTQRLSGACTYAGTTQVTNGALRINGSLSAGGADVTVYSDGTLGGSGTIGRAVSIIGGTLAPGDGVGTLTINSNLTLSAGSVYEWESQDGVGDLVDVNGTLTLPSVATVVVSQVSGSLPDLRTLFTADALAGATTLGGWVIDGMGGYKAVVDGTSVILAPPKGTVILLL